MAAANINTSLDNIDFDDMVSWDGDSFNSYMDDIYGNPYYGVNATGGSYGFNAITDNISGIFGMPYQFSDIVDPQIETQRMSSNSSVNPYKSQVGRKFSEKIFSAMPILFLTPGEPVFMEGFSKETKGNMARNLASILGGGDGSGGNFDEGRYYSFRQNFPEYKRYANTALRALALYMGIGDVSIPVPGKMKFVNLSNIDVEDFMNNSFTKLFGSQATVPFYLDASTSISESFSNGTGESMLSQTVNGFSQSAREIQFIMGSKDYGGLLKSIGSAVEDVSQNIAGAMDEIGSVVSGKSKNLLSRVTNELTTIISGGKIVFPEIWTDSEYDRSYDINLKLRSPDPDPVSIFLNIYMPIILLVSMTAPRQIPNSSNSYESPFLVRATYKSMFSCDLGIISSLSISKGGPGSWNIMGHPTTADVSISIKDLYGSMFISKRMGLIANTAQMDYLATMAGVELNEFEPQRMMMLAGSILGDTARDWLDNGFGLIKADLNKMGAKALSMFTDTRFLS